jgi:hypothetical protein
MQTKMLETSVNKTVKFVLTNALNISAVYTLEIQFNCPGAADSNYTFTTPNTTEPKVKVQYPAQISSISREGAVNVRFYLTVLVPNST